MKYSGNFGSWLRMRRKALGLTQAGLARAIHYSAVAIHKIESGELRPSHAMTAALGIFLQVPESERGAFVDFARGLQTQRRWDNLPEPLTPLLGRASELDAIRQALVEDGVRLLNLLGPPGVGKTRLALQAAHDLRGAFAGGVLFVPLASLTDPAQIPAAIVAMAGGGALNRAPSIDELALYFGEVPVLLVLDNIEHLLDGAGLLTRLLESAARLSVLVTSRQLLNINGERVLEVKPLDIDPAVTLFAARAAAIKPGFAKTPANEAVLVAICHALDCLPLAIELAAARARMLTPPRMLERLRDHAGARFDLLTSGPRNADARQRALRSTIEWSYALLTAEEQCLLRRLSVFVGGCQFEDAAEVCSEPGPNGQAVFEAGISSLADKSLLQVAQSAASPRITLLETIREFALARLEESGEAGVIRMRHARRMLVLAIEASPLSTPPPTGPGPLRRLMAERDNCRAALAWCRTMPQAAPTGLHLAGMLGVPAVFAVRVGGFVSIDDAAPWLACRPEELEALPREAQASVALGLALLADTQGDAITYRSFLNLTRRFAERNQDQRVLLEVLLHDMADRGHAGDAPGVEAVYAQAARIAGPMDDRDPMARLQPAFGTNYVLMGLPDSAMAPLQAALEHWKRKGVGWRPAGGAYDPGLQLSLAFSLKGDFARAGQYAEQAAEDGRDATPSIHWNLLHQAALCALAVRDYARFERNAAEYTRLVQRWALPAQANNTRSHNRLSALRERYALAVLRGSDGNITLDGWSVIALAFIANMRFRADEALTGARLGGAARASASLVDALPPASAAHAYFDYRMYSIRAEIGAEAELLAAFADGERLPLAQAIAEALAS
jgi:predicted ATPase/DNA-binding XRE family transcriptional regulator